MFNTQKDIPKLLINYMSQTFRPIRITAPIEEWRNLKYVNDLFSAQVDYLPNNNPYNIPYNIETLKMYPNFAFDSSFYFYPNKKFMMHPSTYLASIINETQEHNFYLDIYNDTLKEITFDTRGTIPNRWVRMLADFAFKISKIDEDSSVSPEQNIEYWTTKISNIPEYCLTNMARFCVQMMDYSNNITVNIKKAPVYMYDEYKSLCRLDKFVPVRLSEIIIERNITNRIWGTYDGSCEPSTYIFFKKCANYYSLYCSEKQPYYSLAAAEGGIYLAYYHNLPWSIIRPHLVSNANGYHDIRGHTNYSPRKDIPYEEIIVLYEILKKEGAFVDIYKQ